MRNNILTLEEFKEVMEFWKKFNDFQNKINDLLDCMFPDDGYAFVIPDGTDCLLRTLEIMFCDNNEVPSWIKYFTLDLEFGAKYEDGMIKDSDNNIIKLATIEDLYNVLIKEMEENGKL